MRWRLICTTTESVTRRKYIIISIQGCLQGCGNVYNTPTWRQDQLKNKPNQEQKCQEAIRPLSWYLDYRLRWSVLVVKDFITKENTSNDRKELIISRIQGHSDSKAGCYNRRSIGSNQVILQHKIFRGAKIDRKIAGNESVRIFLKLMEDIKWLVMCFSFRKIFVPLKYLAI